MSLQRGSLKQRIRPGGGKSFIGPAAQQKRIGGEEFLEFILLLVCASKSKAPTAVFEPFSAAGIFHNAVQGHVLGNNNFSHGVLLLFFVDSRVFWFTRIACFAACGGRRKRGDARTPRAPAGGLAALLHPLLFRFCRLRRQEEKRGCEDTSRSGRRARRPPAPPAFPVLPPAAAGGKEGMRGHLALRQEGSPPSCIPCFSGFAACGGRRKRGDARTPRAPAGGLAALLHHLLFRFCRLRRQEEKRGCEDTSRSGRRARRPPASPAFPVLLPAAAGGKEGMRGHLALRQEGLPPSCTTCFSVSARKPKSPDSCWFIEPELAVA